MANTKEVIRKKRKKTRIKPKCTFRLGTGCTSLWATPWNTKVLQNLITTSIRRQDSSNLRHLATETWNLPFGHGQPSRTRLQTAVSGWMSAHSRLGLWMLKDVVSNEADYKVAVGKSEQKKRGISTYKNRVKIPESLLTLLWHMPCLRGGWLEVGSRCN